MFFEEQLLLGSTQFFITCYFVKVFCTPVNNLCALLFQVWSIDRLGDLSFELSLLKVQKREEVLSELVLNSSRYSQVNFLNCWLQVHIHLIFHKRGSVFPAIYHCSKWKFCKLSMILGMVKTFTILLTFYHKLVLREGIFGTAASLIPYFAMHKL